MGGWNDCAFVRVGQTWIPREGTPLTSAGIGIADGAAGVAPPRNDECDMRPVCHSWHTIVPPFSWTALVTADQPATCSSVYMPGESTKPLAEKLTADASLTIIPAEARCA